MTDIVINPPRRTPPVEVEAASPAQVSAIMGRGLRGTDGVGIPAGGTAGQALVKASGADYATQWADIAAGDVAWADVTGKPSTFAPSAHGHAIAEVAGLQTALDGKQVAGSYATASQGALAATALQPGAVIPWADVSGKPAFFSGAYGDLTGIPSTFAPSAHNQAWATITATPTTLAGYGISDAATAAQGALAASASQPGHTHAQSDITGLVTALAGKAATVHTHAIADTTGLQSALDGKQPLATVLTNTTAAFTTAQETKLAGIATGAQVNVATDLAYTAATRLLASSTGADVTLPLATGTDAGLMASADFTKLAGIATAATANATDSALRDRATHTGTQAASTISDFTASARAQVEATLVAGANITLTPAGSGATRTITVAAAGGGGGGASGGGTASVNFGAAPGTNIIEQSVSVALPAGARVRAWVSGSTADHNDYEHRAILAGRVSASVSDVSVTGFLITLATELRLTGEIATTYEWSA